MSNPACHVCAHSKRASIDELLKTGEVELDGKNFSTVSKLLDYFKYKYPDEPISNSNVTRHKQAGHLSVQKISKGKSDLAIVYRDNKLYQLEPDGTEKEIEKRDVKDALMILAAVGVHNVLTGKVTMTAKDTVEVLKKLSDMEKGTQTTDEFQDVILEYLRRDKAKIIDQVPHDPDQPTTTQGFLDQLEIHPPEVIKDIPLVQEEDPLPQPIEIDDDGRDN